MKIKKQGGCLLLMSTISAVLISIGVFHFFIEPQTLLSNRCDYFSYSQIEKYPHIAVTPTGMGEVIIHETVTELENLIHTINATGDSGYYGAVMIVKAGASQNNLIYNDEWDYQGKHLELIDPDESRTDITNFNQLENAHVCTEVKILDILYQPPSANIRVGELMRLYEFYYVIDERLPNFLPQFGNSDMYIVDNTIGVLTSFKEYFQWYPLKKGEIYLVYGLYSTTTHLPSKEKIKPLQAGVYCLSKPEENAGFYQDDNLRKENLEWLKEHYDLDKYLK